MMREKARSEAINGEGCMQARGVGADVGVNTSDSDEYPASREMVQAQISTLYGG